MEEKISNSIFLHQQTINELEGIKQRMESSDTEDVRFIVQTKHWYGYSEPFLGKENARINICKYTMKLVLDTAIEKERERINKLIDMEIENRIKGD